jgi:hypothetical protein
MTKSKSLGKSARRVGVRKARAAEREDREFAIRQALEDLTHAKETTPRTRRAATDGLFSLLDRQTSSQVFADRELKQARAAAKAKASKRPSASANASTASCGRA